MKNMKIILKRTIALSIFLILSSFYAIIHTGVILKYFHDHIVNAQCVFENIMIHSNQNQCSMEYDAQVYFKNDIYHLMNQKDRCYLDFEWENNVFFISNNVTCLFYDQSKVIVFEKNQTVLMLFIFFLCIFILSICFLIRNCCQYHRLLKNENRVFIEQRNDMNRILRENPPPHILEERNESSNESSMKTSISSTDSYSTNESRDDSLSNHSIIKVNSFHDIPLDIAIEIQDELKQQQNLLLSNEIH